MTPFGTSIVVFWDSSITFSSVSPHVWLAWFCCLFSLSFPWFPASTLLIIICQTCSYPLQFDSSSCLMFMYTLSINASHLSFYPLPSSIFSSPLPLSLILFSLSSFIHPFLPFSPLILGKIPDRELGHPGSWLWTWCWDCCLCWTYITLRILIWILSLFLWSVAGRH